MKLFNVILSFVFQLFILLNIVFPYDYFTYKVILLACLFSIHLFMSLYNDIIINQDELLWFMCCMLFGMIWTCYGAMGNLENSLSFFKLYFVWPFIFLIMNLIIENYNLQKDFEVALYISLIFIFIMTMNIYLSALGMPHFALLDNISQEIAFGSHDGYTKIGLDSLGNLFFINAYIISKFLLCPSSKKVNKLFLLLMVVCCLITCVIAGRRFLIISTILTPFVLMTVMFISKIPTAKIFRHVIFLYTLSFIIIILLLIYILDFSPYQYIERVLFIGKHFEGVDYRMTKIDQLLSFWEDHGILFGTKFMADNFEITYVKLLVDTGLIGFVLYVFIYFYSIFMLYRNISCKQISTYKQLPIFIGLLMFYFAILSNPLSSFSFMWAQFLPISYIIRDD